MKDGYKRFTKRNILDSEYIELARTTLICVEAPLQWFCRIRTNWTWGHGFSKNKFTAYRLAKKHLQEQLDKKRIK